MTVVGVWFENRFRTLVASWERHHELRLRGAGVPELAEARRRLDEARDAITELRMAFAPEPNEQRLAGGTAYCATLGIVVYLYRPVDPGARLYRCVCGSDVERSALDAVSPD
jgi:hypothetical protein